VNKKFVALCIFVTVVAACVGYNIPRDYAKRAHPECSNFMVVGHSFDSGKSDSLTEISMMCDDTVKSITVKCRFGLGVVSDTVCHENN
jgi:hypothetical protein